MATAVTSARQHTLTSTSDPDRTGSQVSPTWLGIVSTVAAVAIGTLLVYPRKEVAPVVSLGGRVSAGDSLDLRLVGAAFGGC